MSDAVHVLLPVHNRRDVTLRFVACLAAQGYARIRLLMIDDGSTDGTADAVRAAYPHLEVIRGDGTWWWAGSLQRAFARLQALAIPDTDLVLIANDDTQFAPDYVENAVRLLRDRPGSMLLSRLRDPVTGEIGESGLRMDFRSVSVTPVKEQGEINCLSTRGLFLRWGDLKRVGPLHPHLLPHYWSDYEYTIRAMRKGLRSATNDAVWVEPELALTGMRDLSGLAGWTFVKEFFSTRCIINPVYKSSFILLACPWRLIPRNLAREWRQAAILIVRQGVLAGLRRARRRARLEQLVRTSRPLRVVLGSGAVDAAGWIATDIDQLDIAAERQWQRYFRDGDIDTILAEHVWEHLSGAQAASAARQCFRHLRPGGRLRVAVPDGLHPDPAYVDAVKPGGNGPGADDHKVLYTIDSLRSLFENAGFDTRALEYFDDAGRFHFTEWDPADGMIRRSRRFDPRNADGQLRYSSIILDAVKPLATAGEPHA
jgi:predicted SAM-dependent methyltransferase